MNYPAWEVPNIGGSWVIGIISIFHVVIAWFAVGGGLYLPLAERKAIYENKRDWLPVIRTHSRFFLVLTSVFGAISGVGIWFAIGLVHPEATSTLIHNFVFGWAIEWVFFVIELAAAAAYYYSWDRIPEKLHLKIGYLYAASSFLTLVIINGILSFMLTPGASWLSVAGTGQEASRFWEAFFNPTYFPSLMIRTLACLALAGVWALLTLARVNGEIKDSTRVSMIRWSASWLVPMFVLLPVFLVWFLAMTPANNLGLLQLGMANIGSGGFTQVTRIAMLTVITTFTIAGVVYFFAYKLPKDLTWGHAASVMFLAIIATSSTEYVRETIRKPWVIGDHMYSNGIRKSEIDGFNSEGYLTQSMWNPGRTASQVEVGKQVFRGQCMSCHTETGYRSMKRFMAQRDAASTASLLQMLKEHKPESTTSKFMPPLVGSEDEISALGAYLMTLNDQPAVVVTEKATKPSTLAKNQ